MGERDELVSAWADQDRRHVKELRAAEALLDRMAVLLRETANELAGAECDYPPNRGLYARVDALLAAYDAGRGHDGG